MILKAVKEEENCCEAELCVDNIFRLIEMYFANLKSNSPIKLNLSFYFQALENIITSDINILKSNEIKAMQFQGLSREIYYKVSF